MVILKVTAIHDAAEAGYEFVNISEEVPRFTDERASRSIEYGPERAQSLKQFVVGVSSVT